MNVGARLALNKIQMGDDELREQTTYLVLATKSQI